MCVHAKCLIVIGVAVVICTRQEVGSKSSWIANKIVLSMVSATRYSRGKRDGVQGMLHVAVQGSKGGDRNELRK